MTPETVVENAFRLMAGVTLAAGLRQDGGIFRQPHCFLRNSGKKGEHSSEVAWYGGGIFRHGAAICCTCRNPLHHVVYATNQSVPVREYDHLVLTGTEGAGGQVKSETT